VNKITLFVLTLFWHNFIAAELISSEALFTSPTYNMAKLSPNGNYLSIKEKGDKKNSLTIVDLKTLTPYAAGVFSKEEAIKKYIWLNNTQIYLKVRKGNLNLEYIYDLNLSKKSTSTNFHIINSGHIVNWLPKDDKFVLFNKKGGRKSDKNQLYKILINDLKNNNFENAQLIDQTNNKVTSYFYDDKFERIIATELSEDNKEVILKWRTIHNTKWQLLFTYTNEKYQLSPKGFLTENKIAVLSNRDTDKVALHEFDIKTQTLGNILFQHPKYDLTSVEIGNEGKIKSVHFYQNGVYTKHYFDQHDKRFLSRLTKTFKNRTSFIIDSDKSETKHLIYTTASDYPGAYFIYDKSKDKIIRLYESYPNLEQYSFAKTIYIPVTSSDGTQLEAFLTKPINQDHNTLLVMPHGGPIGVQDMDYFNANIQFLANRGFTILRVNFRGSSGFGKAFLEQGVGQFGQLIEQDITAAVNKVQESQNYKHVCSIGSSYGGYSSVMLAIKHPKQYQCVVAAYGVYDLPLLFNTSNYRSGKEYHDYIAKVVGKLDESHLKLSPAYMAEKLHAPLLLIAGKNDEISGIEQSNRFHYLLKNANKTVETIFYDKTGHGHLSWWGERHEMVSTVNFLYRTLSIDEPKPTALSERGNKALATDYVLLADSYDFEHKVSKDPKKAYHYYTKAAEYKNSRALFNIGSYYHRGELVENNINTAIEHYTQSAKLNYAGANKRLGRMYMEGDSIEQNFDKAFKYLSKAYELDDSLHNSMRLGRFYCVANNKYKDMEKCFEHLKLTGVNKLFSQEQINIFSSQEQINTYNTKRQEIAEIFVARNYSKEELHQLQNFLKNTYNFTDIDFEFKIQKSGIFEFKHSKKYGKSGEYILVDEGNKAKAVKGKDLIYGLYFNTDFDGIDSSKDTTIIITKWTRINSKGKSKIIDSGFLLGSPIDEWSALRRISIDDTPATYRLDIYSLNKEKIYTRDFVINE